MKTLIAEDEEVGFEELNRRRLARYGLKPDPPERVEYLKILAMWHVAGARAKARANKRKPTKMFATVTRLLAEYPNERTGEIANRAGCSDVSVRAVRQALMEGRTRTHK